MQKTLDFFKKYCCFCCCCAESEPDSFKECSDKNGGCDDHRHIQLDGQDFAVEASAQEVKPELVDEEERQMVEDPNEENGPELVVLPASMVDEEERQASSETFPEPSVMVEDPNEENGPELIVLPASMVDEDERRAAMVEK